MPLSGQAIGGSNLGCPKGPLAGRGWETAGSAPLQRAPEDLRGMENRVPAEGQGPMEVATPGVRNQGLEAQG